MSFFFINNDFLLFLKIYLFYLRVCLWEGVRSFRTGVTSSCEQPCWSWELNQGPLEEQLVFFTIEPSLQPVFFSFYFKYPLLSLILLWNENDLELLILLPPTCCVLGLQADIPPPPNNSNPFWVLSYCMYVCAPSPLDRVSVWPWLSCNSEIRWD